MSLMTNGHETILDLKRNRAPQNRNTLSQVLSPSFNVILNVFQQYLPLTVKLIFYEAIYRSVTSLITNLWSFLIDLTLLLNFIHSSSYKLIIKFPLLSNSFV